MKKIVGLLAIALLVAALAAPLVSAFPAEEKNNDKFAYFKLICSGASSDIYERTVVTFTEEGALKTFHGFNGGWNTGSTVELTIGDETFTKTTAPYSVDYTTLFDVMVVGDESGITLELIKLRDTVTVYNNDVEIGTLILKISASIDFTVTPPAYQGTVVGYGTGALEGVHISAVDDGLIGPEIYSRTGTITGWSEQITN